MNRRLAAFLSVALLAAAALEIPVAHADNTRLNDSVVDNVYTIRHQAGCTTGINMNPQLMEAARRHTLDVLNNRHLNGDLGSDGSTPQDRATAARFRGMVSQTVAVNPALAISGLEILRQWYYQPPSLAIMRDCANTAIGVWSEHRLDRTVVVAVYGQAADGAPVMIASRQP